MTQRERAARGLLYDPVTDPELIAERARCKALCHEYNHLHPDRTGEREALLRRLFGHVAGAAWIEPPFWCDYGYNVRIGDGFYANHGCVILDCAPVTFGDRVLLGPTCGFYTAGHPLDAAQRAAGLEYAYPITVGSDVWIGAHVAVLPGVTIGDGAVIGAGSVVNRDIPSGVVAAGNPCRVLRRITARDVLAADTPWAALRRR
jgi:maltose O-acetyltransferase